jgi:hypothetical protein
MGMLIKHQTNIKIHRSIDTFSTVKNNKQEHKYREHISLTTNNSSAKTHKTYATMARDS